MKRQTLFTCLLDFNDEQQMVGIEVLHLKRRIPKVDLQGLKVEVASSTG
jgi:hypothetical protein